MTASVTIRHAILHDLETVLQMMEDFYAIERYPFNKPGSRRNLELFIENSQYGKLWVMEDTGQPIGYAALTLGFSFEYGGLTAFLDELYLVPAYRKLGLGKQMITWVLEQARKMGIQSVHLEVERHNAAARRLYDTFGFTDQNRFLLTKKIAP
jgi:ribosomal protein S18 acetylase RimI-like enzyme